MKLIVGFWDHKEAALRSQLPDEYAEIKEDVVPNGRILSVAHFENIISREHKDRKIEPGCCSNEIVKTHTANTNKP